MQKPVRPVRDLAGIDTGTRGVLPGGFAGEMVDQRHAASLSEARRGGKRSEEHTSELQSLMRISYAVFCLKKKNKQTQLHPKLSNTTPHINYIDLSPIIMSITT